MESNDPNDKASKIAAETIAENSKALKEIARLQKLIEETMHKKESLFKDLGITEEIQKEDLSASDLPPAERKIFDAFQREFLTELHAKGLDIQMKIEKKKKIVNKKTSSFSRRKKLW